MWLVPNWLSIPSRVLEKGQLMMAALLIKISIFSMLALMFAALSRIEAWLPRSRGMNLVATAGRDDLISSMTGWILESDRPARMISVGDAAAKEMAVSAPSPPWLGPVIRTRWRVGRG